MEPVDGAALIVTAPARNLSAMRRSCREWHTAIPPKTRSLRDPMSSRWRWTLVVTTATALDLLARFGASFDFVKVMHVEAALFPVTAVLLATLLRYEPPTQGWPHAVRLGLVWLFGLGGLRPVLWTLGLSLTAANLAALIVALAGILAWWLRRRSRRSLTRA